MNTSTLYLAGMMLFFIGLFIKSPTIMVVSVILVTLGYVLPGLISFKKPKEKKKLIERVD
jgi:uncharacterized protein YjeT (DUF2065 family)